MILTRMRDERRSGKLRYIPLYPETNGTGSGSKKLAGIN